MGKSRDQESFQGLRDCARLSMSVGNGAYVLLALDPPPQCYQKDTGECTGVFGAVGIARPFFPYRDLEGTAANLQSELPMLREGQVRQDSRSCDWCRRGKKGGFCWGWDSQGGVRGHWAHLASFPCVRWGLCYDLLSACLDIAPMFHLSPAALAGGELTRTLLGARSRCQGV